MNSQYVNILGCYSIMIYLINWILIYVNNYSFRSLLYLNNKYCLSRHVFDKLRFYIQNCTDDWVSTDITVYLWCCKYCMFSQKQQKLRRSGAWLSDWYCNAVTSWRWAQAAQGNSQKWSHWNCNFSNIYYISKINIVDKDELES